MLGWLIADTWRLPLRSGETVLGREGDGVVPLPSPSVSRQHAALIIEGTAARLRDLGSKNGTFVDEMRVERPIALRDGARLRFGTLDVIYRSADADLVDRNDLDRRYRFSASPFWQAQRAMRLPALSADDAALHARIFCRRMLAPNISAAIQHVRVSRRARPSCTTRTHPRCR